MNTKTKKTLGIVGGSAAVVALLLALSPVGTFLQSSLLNTPYAAKDSGLYVGVEEQTSAGKELKASQGVTLRSEVAQSGDKNYLNVYLTAHVGGENLEADSMKGVLTYDASKLTATSIANSLKTLTSNTTIDGDFSTILKDSSGQEIGEMHFGVDKTSNFTAPKEEVLKAVFELKDGTQFADVAVRTVKLYKRAYLSDITKPTLYLTRGGENNAVYEPLVATNDGATVSTNEASTTEGGKVRTDVFKDKDGATIKTIVTTYDSTGRIIKILTTYADGSKEESTFVYNDDGSYQETVVTTDKDGKLTTVVKAYDKDGKLMANDTTTGEVTAAITLVSDDQRAKVVIPAGAAPKGATFELKEVEKGALASLDNVLLPLTKGYEVVAKDASGEAIAGTLKNMEMQFIYTETDLPVAPTGKTLSEVYPYMFDQTQNKWIRLARGAATSPIAIKSTAASTYMLAVAALAPGEDLHSVTTSTGSTMATDTCTPAEAFTDTNGHWAETYIDQARKACIVGGSGQFAGRFFPDEAVTRAELTKMATTAFEVTAPASAPTKAFVDVRSSDWFAPVVALASKSGIVQGYADSSFKPNDNINRAEALKIILEAYVKSGKGSADFDQQFATWRAQFPTYTYVQFEDTFISDWFAKYVFYGWANNIVEGYTQNGIKKFGPGQDITRAEALKILMELR